MEKTAGILVVVFFFGALLWYAPLILNRIVSPPPATWIIGCSAVTLSVWSYHHTPGASILGNVALYGTATSMVITLGFIVFALVRDREWKVSFDPFQKMCLVIMGITLAVFVFNKDRADVAYWTTQVLLVVAYAVTLVKVIKRGVAFDSIGNWALIFMGSVAGSLPAVMKQDPAGIGNVARAVISSGILLACLIWYDRKTGFKRWKEEVVALKTFYIQNK